MSETTQIAGKIGRIAALVVACIVAVLWSLRYLQPEIVEVYQTRSGASYTGILSALAVYLLTFGVLIVLAVWAVLHFAVVRWTAPDKTSAYFLIVLGAVVASNVGLVSYQYFDIERTVGHEREVIDAVRAELDKAVAKLDSAAPVDMRVESKGEAGEIVRIVKQLVAANHAATRDYRAAIHGLGFPDVVAPRHLAADPGLADTRARLKKARAAVTDYRKRIEANRIAFRAAIKRAPIGDGLKKTVIAQFDGRIATLGEDQITLYSSEDAVFAELSFMAEDLGHARGRWWAQGKKIVFADRRDLAVYNEHILNAQASRRAGTTRSAAYWRRTKDAR